MQLITFKEKKMNNIGTDNGIAPKTEAQKIIKTVDDVAFLLI